MDRSLYKPCQATALPNKSTDADGVDQFHLALRPPTLAAYNELNGIREQ